MPSATQEPSTNAEATTDTALPVVPSLFGRLTLKKVLYHPLAGIAIAAHLLLLVLPFSKPEPPNLDDDIPTEEVDNSIPVDILNLSALSPPPADQSSEILPPSLAAVPAPAANSPPPPTASPLPTEQPPMAQPVERSAVQPVEQSVEQLVAQTPIEQTQAQTMQTPVEQVPAYVAQADQQAFVNNVGALGAGTQGIGNFRDIGLPGIDYFSKGNVANFLDYSTDPPSLLPGSIDAVWMDKQAERVAEQIEVTYGANGVTLERLSNYGDELLYEMLTPNGDTIMYISLVNFPSKGSSLMVSWTMNPINS